MNSKGHLMISLVKSVIRIVGCFWAIVSKDIGMLAAFLAAAELLGILEELADKR